MNDIKLHKRVKFAGDVHAALVEDGWGSEDAAYFLNRIPDARGADVVQGYWIDKSKTIVKGGRKFINYRFDCSACGHVYWFALNFNYCPMCGARMEGVRHD